MFHRKNIITFLPKKIFCSALCLIFVLTAAGCGTSDQHGTDIPFTVISEPRLPEDLHQKIDERKDAPFEFTYTSEGYTYLCTGYGIMESTGYSITVNELCLQGSLIILDTTLVGPAEGEYLTDEPSTPYIVLKIEATDALVEFR